jgi:hypothetical protein
MACVKGLRFSAGSSDVKCVRGRSGRLPASVPGKRRGPE